MPMTTTHNEAVNLSAYANRRPPGCRCDDLAAHVHAALGGPPPCPVHSADAEAAPATATPGDGARMDDLARRAGDAAMPLTHMDHVLHALLPGSQLG